MNSVYFLKRALTGVCFLWICEHYLDSLQASESQSILFILKRMDFSEYLCFDIFKEAFSWRDLGLHFTESLDGYLLWTGMNAEGNCGFPTWDIIPMYSGKGCRKFENVKRDNRRAGWHLKSGLPEYQARIIIKSLFKELSWRIRTGFIWLGTGTMCGLWENNGASVRSVEGRRFPE
jgi:hypothetical protein